jgi:hypothetical protein
MTDLPKLSQPELEKEIQRLLEKGCWAKLRDKCIVSKIYMTYKQSYYLGKPIVTDQEFDRYEDMLKDQWPTNPCLKWVGLVYSSCKCCKPKKDTP